MTDKSHVVRNKVIQSITDKAVLANVALNDKSSIVRMAAIRRITDQKLLLTILTVSPEWSDRKLAFGKLQKHAAKAVRFRGDLGGHRFSRPPRRANHCGYE